MDAIQDRRRVYRPSVLHSGAPSDGPQLLASLINLNTTLLDEATASPARITLSPTTSIDQIIAEFPITEHLLAFRARERDCQNASWTVEARQKLRTVFKMERFRVNQLEAIEATMHGQDVFVLMPTAWGKSLCFQLPAVCAGGRTTGLTVVIEPLISLIDDQVQALLEKGIDVETIHSDMPLPRANRIRHRLRHASKRPKLLYVTPEMIQTSVMNDILNVIYQQHHLARFVVDEAHCISEWGRDFRPAYRALDVLRKNFPNVPIMALTGTASKRVTNDVVTCLGIDGCVQLRQSFDRPNLNYVVKPKERNSLHDIAEAIMTKHNGETGIIYCRSRNDCDKISQKLTNVYKIASRAYHSGLASHAKQKVLQDWQNGSCQVVVATTAFGMGIDKADVRFVIHHCLPRSLEGYYQETGRAGRDGSPADCILYYRYRDGEYLFTAIRNDGGLSVQGKRAAEEGLRHVMQFCQNDIDCRRRQLLSYFDEEFDAQSCESHCDNCRDTRPIVSHDITQFSTTIITQLSNEMPCITRGQLVDTIKGSRTAVVKKKNFHELGLFELCKGWNGDCERLVDLMISKQYLTTYSARISYSWTQEYLQVSILPQ
ncbi:ATP-dependent DNA helicase [Obba rivulosa]|uniref:ATP-dependent DNA helicase n=1 Tax=Obba rivulosa TaxID=1052685 RepID=A0A8E2DR64_9APHY|nr:ATP-dependent DNA helicase [Obba rivulosa]